MTQLFEQRGNHRIMTHADDDGRGRERFVIASEMECDALIAENRRLRQDREATCKAKETFRLVARFPAPIVEQAMQQGWFHDDDEWAKRVNDPQYRDFRVVEGRF